jgi:hypothetical protein
MAFGLGLQINALHPKVIGLDVGIFLMLKTVTLQEANGLLPLVQEHFLRIHMLLFNMHKLHSKKSKNKNTRVFDNTVQTLVLSHKKPTNKRMRRNLKKLKMLNLLVRKEILKLLNCGAVIKSIFPPHIDFLSLKNNELLFLCWHGGEKEITHCHHLDEHSPIRHIIPTKSYFGPHVVH